MEYRTLGSTGVSVSTHCLGAMMFGGDGQHRRGGLRADHPRRARRWHQLRRHRRRLLGRAVRGDRRTRAQGPPRRRGARHEGALRDGGGRQPAGQLPGVDHARGGGQPAPARHRPHRPVSDPPAGATDRYRGDAERAHRSAATGEDPVLRFVHLPGLADGRGAVDGGASWPGPVPHRAAAVLDLRPSDRAGRPAGRRSATAWACWCGARSAADGSPAGTGATGSTTRRSPAPVPHRSGERRGPVRPVASGDPAEARPGRIAREGLGRRRRLHDPHGDRVHAGPPRGDVGHHRTADDGAAPGRAGRRRRPPRRGDARRDRRGRAARHPRGRERPRTSNRGGWRPRRAAADPAYASPLRPRSV